MLTLKFLEQLVNEYDKEKGVFRLFGDQKDIVDLKAFIVRRKAESKTEADAPFGLQDLFSLFEIVRGREQYGLKKNEHVSAQKLSSLEYQLRDELGDEEYQLLSQVKTEISFETFKGIVAKETLPPFLHPVWVGHRAIPDKNVRNILNWLNDNPERESIVWVDTTEHPNVPDQKNEMRPVMQVTAEKISSIADQLAKEDPLKYAHLKEILKKKLRIDDVSKVISKELPEAWKLIRYYMCNTDSNYGAASDIIRLCLLYLFGGGYFDCGDVLPGRIKLRNFIRERAGFPLLYYRVFEQGSNEANNDFIFVTRKHPAILRLLKQIIAGNKFHFTSEVNEDKKNSKLLQPEYPAIIRELLFSYGFGNYQRFVGTINSTGPSAFRYMLDTNQAESNKVFQVLKTKGGYEEPPRQDLSWTDPLNASIFCDQKATLVQRIDRIIEKLVPAINVEIDQGRFRLSHYIHSVAQAAYGEHGSYNSDDLTNISRIFIAKLTASRSDFKTVKMVQVLDEQKEVIDFYQKYTPEAFKLVLPTLEILQSRWDNVEDAFAVHMQSLVITELNHHLVDRSRYQGFYFAHYTGDFRRLLFNSLSYIKLLSKHIEKELLPHSLENPLVMKYVDYVTARVNSMLAGLKRIADSKSSEYMKEIALISGSLSKLKISAGQTLKLGEVK